MLIDKIKRAERKLISKASVEEAIGIIKNLNNVHFIILAQSHWHQGIIGLIAARIMDKYKKPTAILSKDKDGYFRGSVRSTKNIHATKALENCSSCLEAYGGHAGAAGFTIKAENIATLEKSLNQYASQIESSSNIFSIEPEVLDLINFLNKSGAKIKFLGKRSIKITGVKELLSGSHNIIGDRIEAFSYLCVGAITNGNIKANNIDPGQLRSEISTLKKIG